MSLVHPLFRASQRAVTLVPDLRGQPVLDADGEKIGHVDDVLIEERSVEETGILTSGITPRYLEVGSGRHFHLGERKALLSVDDITIETMVCGSTRAGSTCLVPTRRCRLCPKGSARALRSNQSGATA